MMHNMEALQLLVDPRLQLAALTNSGAETGRFRLEASRLLQTARAIVSMVGTGP